MLLRAQTDAQRHYLPSFAPQRLLQQRMPRLAQYDATFLGNERHTGDDVQGISGLGHKEVYFPCEAGGVGQLGYIRSYEIREFVEQAHYFPLLGKLQVLYLVFQLYQLGRLYEGRLAGCGFVIYEAGQLAFRRHRHGDEHLAVTHGHGGIRLGEALLLGAAKHGGGTAGHSPFLFAQRLAYVVKDIGGAVPDVSVAVHQQVDAPAHLREGCHCRSHTLQVRVNPVFDRVEKQSYLAQGIEHGPELAQRQQVYARPLVGEGQEEVKTVYVTGRREAFLEHHNQLHLVTEKQTASDFGRIGAELLPGHPVHGIRGGTVVRYGGPDPVKAQFLLKLQIYLRRIHPE